MRKSLVKKKFSLQNRHAGKTVIQVDVLILNLIAVHSRTKPQSRTLAQSKLWMHLGDHPRNRTKALKTALEFDRVIMSLLMREETLHGGLDNWRLWFTTEVFRLIWVEEWEEWSIWLPLIESRVTLSLSHLSYKLMCGFTRALNAMRINYLCTNNKINQHIRILIVRETLM